MFIRPVAFAQGQGGLLVGAVTASAIGSLLFVIADGLPLLVTGRVITGLGFGAYLPASRAIVRLATARATARVVTRPSLRGV